MNGMEDVDFALKLRCRGRRCLYTSHSVVTHFESRSPHRHARMEENLALFLNKWSSFIQPDDAFYYSQDNMAIERTPLGMAYKNLVTGELYYEPERLFGQAKNWLMTGRTDEALLFFDELLAHDPYHEGALSALAEFSTKVKNVAAAKRFYGKLSALHP